MKPCNAGRYVSGKELDGIAGDLEKLLTERDEAVAALDAAKDEARQACAEWEDIRKERDTAVGKVDGLLLVIADLRAVMPATGDTMHILAMRGADQALAEAA